MESLHELEVIILLLAVVLALTTIAQKIRIPYPIFLVQPLDRATCFASARSVAPTRLDRKAGLTYNSGMVPNAPSA